MFRNLSDSWIEGIDGVDNKPENVQPGYFGLILGRRD
jgi:hypothetical protein